MRRRVFEETKMHSFVWKESTVYQSDFATLDDGCWLNDAVVFCALQHAALLAQHQNRKAEVVSPGAMFILRHENDTDDIDDIVEPLLEADTVLFPVNNAAVSNDSGTHWSLLVATRGQGTNWTTFHVDSHGNYNAEAAAQLSQQLRESTSRLVQNVGSGSHSTVQQCAQQDNSSDCGLFCIAQARHYLQHGDVIRTDGLPVDTRVLRTEVRQMLQRLTQLARGTGDNRDLSAIPFERIQAVLASD